MGELAFDAYRHSHGLPDVLHVHSVLDAGVLAMRLSARFRIPYVMTEHSTAFARGQLSVDELQLASKIARNASSRIAVSPQLAELLRRTLCVGSGDWVTVPNIVDTSFFLHPLGTINPGKFTFINVGLMDVKKGQDVLLMAFARARRVDPHLALVIVGDGEEETRLRKLAQTLGLGDDVTFAGRLSRSQVRDRVSDADGLVLSSSVETFGVVVAEALALGKPVVATRCGGPESIVREGDGELAPAGDIEGLATAMVRVARERNRFDPVTLREGCRARFGEDSVVRMLRDQYAIVTAPPIGSVTSVSRGTDT
jgi:glycosyltransferase involved in cell wall biosynthesis